MLRELDKWKSLTAQKSNTEADSLSHNPQSFQELHFSNKEKLELEVGAVSSTVLLNLFEIDTPVLITELQLHVSEVSSTDNKSVRNRDARSNG